MKQRTQISPEDNLGLVNPERSVSHFGLHGREHVDGTHLPQRSQQTVRGPGVVVHNLQKVLKLAAVLYGELSESVHVEEIMVDLTTMAQTQGKAVHLGSGRVTSSNTTC